MIAARDVARLHDRAAAPGSTVLSVYLDVDQSRAKNLNREFEVALRTRLRALEHQGADAEREGFRADAARVRRFVSEYTPHAKTLVLFADGSSGFFWSGELRTTLPEDVRRGPTPWVRPLLEALDEHQRYGVILVDKGRARVFTVFLGEIEEERDAIAGAETRHKKSSGTDHLLSQMNFQRKDDMHVDQHLRHVAELTEDLARSYAFDRLMLAGPVEATSELARLLPRTLAERMVGTFRIAFDAPTADILRQTLEIAEGIEREAEKRCVAEILERGAIGLDATVAALQEGRLHVLVYADGFAAPGSECLRCRALFAGGAVAACGYCGGQLRTLDDLVGRAVERAGDAAATIEKVHGEAAARLRDAGGIGAMLRF